MFEINNKAKEKMLARQKSQREASARIDEILNRKMQEYMHEMAKYQSAMMSSTGYTSQGLYASMMEYDLKNDDTTYGV